MSEIPWNDLIEGLPEAHLLQSAEWGQLKALYGWQPLHLVWSGGARMQVLKSASVPRELLTGQVKAAALLLRRRVFAGLCLLYCPKGPLLRWEDPALRARVLDDLQAFARAQGAIFLKIDPDVILASGLPGAADELPNPDGLALQQELSGRGWRYSRDQVQFRNTVLLDVDQPDEVLLARMKQKTRYNVRLGTKKGLTLRLGDEKDWALLYRMYAATSVRDGFVIRSEEYYRQVWRLFRERSAALLAEFEGEPVAAVYLFHFAQKTYYLYGMSRDIERDKMPNYFLQFEAMRWARAQGCRIYDLWGAPEVFAESDSMWGVFRFKEGLGGKVRRSLGAWDYVPNRLLYRLYTQIMPRALDLMRSRGRKQARQAAFPD